MAARIPEAHSLSQPSRNGVVESRHRGGDPMLPEGAGLSAPHQTALFAMAAQRLEQPGSKLAWARRRSSGVAVSGDLPIKAANART
jgi:hypothetical protein